MSSIRFIAIGIILFVLTENIFGQKLSFFEPSDTLNKSRFNHALIFSAGTYTAFSVGLYHTWYKNFPQESFHFFNDYGEWQQMDKIGHIYTAYLQGVLCYKGAKWTGLNKKNAILTGMICGTLFQTTIEVMDGFSSQWGFSISDMGANIAGTATFALQQHYWNEQKISLKVSSSARKYSQDPLLSLSNGKESSLRNRADDLFGKTFLERYLKDYNAQTYWASFNVHSFLSKNNQWPKWLNIAVGYGAENMYGGFENKWSEGNEVFILPADQYKRYRQFYLSPDINLEKLNPKSHFLKTICSVFNIFKLPAPALEINTNGEVIFHFIKL